MDFAFIMQTSRVKPRFPNADITAMVDKIGHRTATLLDVSPATLRTWIRGTSYPSAATCHLARLLTTGDLSEILGTDWREISITPAGLLLPGWKRPFTPAELHAHFYAHAFRYRLEWECKQLAQQLAQEQNRNEILENRLAELSWTLGESRKRDRAVTG